MEIISRFLRARNIEYAVLDIDENGDAFDSYHFDTLSEAKHAMWKLMEEEGAVAALIEKVNEATDDRTVIATMGNEDALKMGGWIDMTPEEKLILDKKLEEEMLNKQYPYRKIRF